MSSRPTQRTSRHLYLLYGCLLLTLILNISFWRWSHHRKIEWANVPAPPTEAGLTASFLGDRMLAYRVWGMALQNFGNAGGNYEPLKNYNYTYLGMWFDLLDKMDHRSDFVPLLAAYYYGSTQNSQEQLPVVIAYLEKVGSRPEDEKWRWLAQAMYLARHRLNDLPLALRLAEKLAGMYRPGMPAWTLQAKALIADQMGDKEAAYVMLKSMLATETQHMQPAEINFMVDYICSKILTPLQAAHDPLCMPVQLKSN